MATKAPATIPESVLVSLSELEALADQAARIYRCLALTSSPLKPGDDPLLMDDPAACQRLSWAVRWAREQWQHVQRLIADGLAEQSASASTPPTATRKRASRRKARAGR
jgi:hypothetical protein